MRAITVISMAITIGCVSETALGQFGQQQPAAGAQPAQQSVQRWQVGVIIDAGRIPCRGLFGTVPVPSRWPEQDVQRTDEDVSANVTSLRYATLDGVWQMKYTIPQLPAGDKAHALLTFEVRRRSIPAPADTSGFVIPKNVPPQIRHFLAASPPRDPRGPRSIDPLHRAVRNKAKEIVEGKESAWEQVESLYDWVRDNIKYVNTPFKGSTKTLEDGVGSRDDLNCLFIALCRSLRIPARVVWVPDNAYVEFYLQDGAGQGRWFPCQVAGTREFGTISDLRPILQKGDNIDVPGLGPQFFVAEHLEGRGGSPNVQFVRKLLPAN